MVGYFEDALERWRQQRRPWQEPSDDLLLSVAEGAIQVRLSRGVVGEEPLTADLPEPAPPPVRVVGLVWRSVVLWLLLLALALLARTDLPPVGSGGQGRGHALSVRAALNSSYRSWYIRQRCGGRSASCGAMAA